MNNEAYRIMCILTEHDVEILRSIITGVRTYMSTKNMRRDSVIATYISIGNKYIRALMATEEEAMRSIRWMTRLECMEFLYDEDVKDDEVQVMIITRTEGEPNSEFSIPIQSYISKYGNYYYGVDPEIVDKYPKRHTRNRY